MLLLTILSCLINTDLYEERLEELLDQDGDGFESAAYPEHGGTDCDDNDSEIHPGAIEYCDQIDNDCDGDADEDAVDTQPWYLDSDGDGFGAGDPVLACSPPGDHVSNNIDCNDANANQAPGNTEIAYDGIDQDCSGEDLDDLDEDGWPGSETDCDDDDASVHPEANEGWLDDGTDNDCDGSNLDEVMWSASEASTHFTGTIAAGELGRQIGFWEEGACLLMSAPYAQDASGMVYATTGGNPGSHTVESLGAFHVSQSAVGLSSVIDINQEGTLVLTGVGLNSAAGRAWLLDPQPACDGDSISVDEAALLTLEGSEAASFFGGSGMWLPDLAGTGASALALVAGYATGGGTERGAAYIWLSPPLDASIIVADDADVIIVGDRDGVHLGNIAVAGTVDESALFLSQEAVSSGDRVAMRITAEDLVSGVGADLATGSIFTSTTNYLPKISVIGDVDRDGDDNIVVDTPDFGMWNAGDIVGTVDDWTARSTFGWSREGEWLTQVVSAGDTDSDGRFDMLLLAEDWPEVTEQGMLGVLTADDWQNSSLNDLESVRLTAAGEASGDSFGYHAVPVGDFDGDGRDDFAVSAYGTDEADTAAGSVYLLPVP